MGKSPQQQIEELEKKNAELRKSVKWWEDKECHEAMSCCVNNLELVALREERDLLRECNDDRQAAFKLMKEAYDEVEGERDRYRQALKVISRTDYVNEFNEKGQIVRVKYPDDIANEALKEKV